MSHMKKVTRIEVVCTILAFIILATTKWCNYYQVVLFTHCTNFPCLTYTGKEVSENLIPSFFMVLSSKMKPIFGLACHMLILVLNYVQQSSVTFVKQ